MRRSPSGSQSAKRQCAITCQTSLTNSGYGRGRRLSCSRLTADSELEIAQEPRSASAELCLRDYVERPNVRPLDSELAGARVFSKTDLPQIAKPGTRGCACCGANCAGRSLDS